MAEETFCEGIIFTEELIGGHINVVTSLSTVEMFVEKVFAEKVFVAEKVSVGEKFGGQVEAKTSISEMLKTSSRLVMEFLAENKVFT